MILQFINRYINKLTDVDFNIVSNHDLFYTHKLDENTKFVSLIKYYGTGLYRVILCNTSNIDLNDYYNLIQTYTNQILTDDNIDFKNIYNIHIFLSIEQSNEVKNILNRGKPFENDSVYNIFWSVVLNNNEFYFNYNKNQPSEIIGISKLLALSAKEFQSSNSDDKPNDYMLNLDNINNLKNKNHIEVNNCTPYLCSLIFLINITMFIILELSGGSNNIENLLMFGALHPEIVLSHNEYHRIITSFFLHAGLFHFLSNSLGLYIFGIRVEKHFGSFKFVLIYMLSGLCSSVFSVMFTQSISVGASGAIYGLIGAICARTYLLNKNIDGLSAYTIIIIIITGIGSGFVIPYIDNYGHIGGLLMGLIIGLFFTKTERNQKLYKSQL